MDTISKLPYEAEIFIKSKFLKVQIVEIEKSENIFKVELDNEVLLLVSSPPSPQDTNPKVKNALKANIKTFLFFIFSPFIQ